MRKSEKKTTYNTLKIQEEEKEVSSCIVKKSDMKASMSVGIMVANNFNAEKTFLLMPGYEPATSEKCAEGERKMAIMPLVRQPTTSGMR